MSNSYSDPHQRGRSFDSSREGSRGAGYRGGGRGPANREGGGFRIRLSDNEMRSARAIQETFGLRSTVAVLGFAVRTIGQLIEEGKLEEVIAAHKSQSASARGRESQSGNEERRGRFNSSKNFNEGSPKPNPFARPEKPLPKESESTEQEINSEEEDQDSSIKDQIDNDKGSDNSDPLPDLEKASDEGEESGQSSTQN